MKFFEHDSSFSPVRSLILSLSSSRFRNESVRRFSFSSPPIRLSSDFVASRFASTTNGFIRRFLLADENVLVRSRPVRSASSSDATGWRRHDFLLQHLFRVTRSRETKRNETLRLGALARGPCRRKRRNQRKSSTDVESSRHGKTTNSDRRAKTKANSSSVEENGQIMETVEEDGRVTSRKVNGVTQAIK